MVEKTKFDVRTERCDQCRFYDVLTDISTKQQTAICRRRPPVTYAQAIPQASAPGRPVGIGWNYSSMWAMVKDTDWCGEFEARLHS